MPKHAEGVFNSLEAEVDLADKSRFVISAKNAVRRVDDRVVLAEKRGSENPERRWTGGCITSTAAWRIGNAIG